MYPNLAFPFVRSFVRTLVRPFGRTFISPFVRTFIRHFVRTIKRPLFQVGLILYAGLKVNYYVPLGGLII